MEEFPSIERFFMLAYPTFIDKPLDVIEQTPWRFDCILHLSQPPQVGEHILVRRPETMALCSVVTVVHVDGSMDPPFLFLAKR